MNFHSILRSFLIFAFCLIISLSTFTYANAQESPSSITRFEYSKEELDSAFLTKDMIYNYYTKNKVEAYLKVQEASHMPASNEYCRPDITDEDINSFYMSMEKLVAAARPLSYYFSNVYWQSRTDQYYGPNTISLTLVPTNAVKNDPDQNNRAASWLLVKNTCSSSSHWTNEASISKQFDCHYMGEVLHYQGVIGAVGNWDLEPIRPAYGAFTFAINRCNPHP